MTHLPPPICVECGGKEFIAFVNETLCIDKDTPVHGLNGYRCTFCGEVDLDKTSHARFASACEEYATALQAKERDMLRRVRKRLGLTQQQAARLTGGGHNAFSRYERGEASPMAAVVNLFKILDKHPELLEEIRN